MRDGEVADRALDLLDLGVGEQRDVLVLAHLRHARGQDAGRAVEGGEGLVELRHVAADRGLALDEVDGEPRVGQLEGGLDPRDPAPDDERRGVHLHRHRLERLLVGDPAHRAGERWPGLVGGRPLLLRAPRDVLADVRHLEEVGVEARVRAGAAEGLLVEVGRAGRHHDPVELLLLDVLLDHLLAERGAHELVVAGDDDAGEGLARPAGHLRDVHHARDVRAAVADVDADRGAGRCRSSGSSLMTPSRARAGPSSAAWAGSCRPSSGAAFAGAGAGAGGRSTPILASAFSPRRAPSRARGPRPGGRRRGP